MIEGPLVEIVVPVWNSGKNIHDFIEGIINQTYKNFLVIIVYDDSTDDTLQQLEQYKEKYPGKIIVLLSPIRKGLGHARDFALESGILKGKYIIFLDSDDCVEACFLEKMVKTAEDNMADLVICGLDCFDDKTGRTISTQLINIKYTIIDNVKEFYSIAYINPAVWNKLYLRESIKDIRFGNLRSMEDAIYFVKVLPYIHKIVFVKEVLYHYRVSEYSLQGQIKASEFKIRWGYYNDLYKYLINHSNVYSDYMIIYELIAFKLCAIGLTYRTACIDKKNMFKYCAYSKSMLDQIVPGWRRNPMLSFRSFMKKTMKENAISFCALLYKANAFPLFVYSYLLFKRITGKEVRM